MAPYDDKHVGVSTVMLLEQILGTNAKDHRVHSDLEILKAFKMLHRIIDGFRTFPLLTLDAAS
jgi:hypothetical protein